MENCNPTDRETFLEEKIRALHDTMRLVGAVSKGDSDDDLVSIEDENEIDDMASSLLTYEKDETLSRRVVFAQAFEILKLRQQLVKVQSNYTEDVRKFEDRIRTQRKRVCALRARIVGKSMPRQEPQETTMRALEEQIKVLKVDLASSKRKIMTYRAAFTYVLFYIEFNKATCDVHSHVCITHALI